MFAEDLVYKILAYPAATRITESKIGDQVPEFVKGCNLYLFR